MLTCPAAAATETAGASCWASSTETNLSMRPRRRRLARPRRTPGHAGQAHPRHLTDWSSIPIRRSMQG